jgi:hypothetical protein
MGLFDLVTLSFLLAIGQFTLRFLSLSPVLLIRLQSTLNSIFFTSYQDHCSVFHLHDNLFVAFLFDRAIFISGSQLCAGFSTAPFRHIMGMRMPLPLNMLMSDVSASF